MTAATKSEHIPDTAIGLALYRKMVRIRTVEEGIAARYSEQTMRCPVHLSSGQEAIAVGVCQALRSDDQIVTTHRCHAHYLAKGGDLRAMLCELMGRAPGCCGGRGGSMHLFDREAGILLSLPIVASSIPVGVGAALKMKQCEENSVTVVFLGDASVEEGVFHESINFAVIQRLPVIFICENNNYSVYTPLNQRQPERPIADLARAHGTPADAVDGNNALSVYVATLQAVQVARSGGGPTFLQMDTYRHREHCGPNFDDHLNYRPAEDVKHWLARDPVATIEKELLESGALAPRDIEQISKGAKSEFEVAYDFASEAPFSESDSGELGVYG